MNIVFPSSEFDDAVAAVCHDTASDEQARGLNELLRTDPAARDEYILRLELHSSLASEPDLFAGAEASSADAVEPVRAAARTIILPGVFSGKNVRLTWAAALAASLAFVVFAIWTLRPAAPRDPPEPMSKAVAMLNRTADAQWNEPDATLRLNAPLEPGPLRLQAGLAQVVFYSGTRVVLEGPAELDLISDNEAFCRGGRIIVEVPAQARGFRVNTPHGKTVDLGTSYGLTVTGASTDLHVFQGSVKWNSAALDFDQTLEAGRGVRIGAARAPAPFAASRSAFGSLFDFQARSEAAEARRYEEWRTACKRLETDPSLLLQFDFENVLSAGWQIPNLGNALSGISDATLVGCQWTEGRWPGKRALEFQSVNDRLRLAVPGEFESLTLSAWVCVKGLDRKINSIFMSDGFDPGTIHWLIRRDGVLGLTVIGADPRDHQIVASPPVVTLDAFGLWLHLAVVLDASAQRVVHYFNGVPVSDARLKIAPPFRVGSAELGNWHAKGFPEKDPFMIRNFSGALDEFLLFSRALRPDEVRSLFAQGKPQGEMLAR